MASNASYFSDEGKKYFIDILDHDNKSTRDKIFNIARKHKDLFTPKYNVPLNTHRQVAYDRLKAICSDNILSVRDFDTNPMNIFTAHEATAMLDASLATKMTVQFNLFGGTLLRFGTKKMHEIVPKIDNFSQVGCFALTELGFGNNAIEMETTATFDEKKNEWIINCPTRLSQKYWITNGALHAHWCIVFAQTIVNKKQEGIHPFLVRIRNDNLKVCNGVTIEDMGMKIGCNGVDNAKLHFNNVRIPKENLLDKISQLTDKNEFKSIVQGRRARFIYQADQLLSGRLCIASMMMGSAKVTLLTAIRYSMTRLCVGPTGKSDTPIGKYQLIKSTFAPLFAKTIALNMLLSESKELYDQVTKLRVTNNETKQYHDLKDQLNLLCCSIKPLLSWHIERVASICRERCGGQGYLAANGFGEAIGGSHAGLTAEGDNRVLYQKLSKELLTLCAKNKVEYDINAKNLYTTNMNTISYCDDLYWILGLLQAKEIKMVTDLSKDMKTHSEESIFQIWFYEKSREVQSIAQSFGERRALAATLRMMQKIKTSSIKDKDKIYSVFELCAKLFAYDAIKEDALYLTSNNIINYDTARQIISLRDNISNKLGDLLPQLVECIGVPSDLVFAPIANDWKEYNDHAAPKLGEVTKAINAKL